MEPITGSDATKAVSSRRENLFLILLVSVALTLPFKAIYNSICCLALFFFWMIFMPKHFARRALFGILLQSMVFWLALIGLLYSVDLQEGWFRTQQKALLFLLPLVIGTAKVAGHRIQHWVLSAFIAVTLLACLYCLSDGLRWWWVHGAFDRFFAHGLVEAIDLYTYIMALLCLTSLVILIFAQLGHVDLHPVLQGRRSGLVLGAFFSFFILLLSVKQIIIAWALLALGGCWFVLPARSRLIATLATVAVLTGAVLFVPSLNEKIEEVTEQEHIKLDEDTSLGRNWNGIALREAIWRCAWGAINQEFWMGYGTGDAQQALQQSYEDRKFYFASRHNRFNAHNQYLQTWIAHGVVGLLIWLMSLIMLFYLQRSNRLFLVVLGVFTFSMLTESMLETNKGNLLMGFLIAIVFSRTAVAESPKNFSL